MDDDVVYGCHDESDLHSIGRAGEVGVDLLRGMLVESVVCQSFRLELIKLEEILTIRIC